MRIGFVLAALQAGGAERVVAQLSAAMVERGWSVEVIAFDRPDDPIYHPLDPRVACTRLALPSDGGGMRGAWRSARRIAALRRHLKTQRFDTVISFLTKINVMTLLAGAGLSSPIIVSERNNPLRQQASKLWHLSTGLLYRGAADIVIMSERSRQALPAGVRSRATIIPNPVRDSGVRPASQARTFVAVGRLTHQKGFDLLIDAFAMASPSLPGWQLIIYGEGPDRAQLEQRRMRHGLLHRVHLPGTTNVPQEWISQASVFVLSSRYEGWPNALAEALAAGTPCIAFDCDFGAAEMVIPDETGLLVPAEDVSALARALQRLAENPALRHRLASAARVRMTQFETDRIIDQWRKLVIAAGASAPGAPK